MKYNKSETDTTKKSGSDGGINTVGVGKIGSQNNTVSLTNQEQAQRGSERASEVVVVVD